MFDYGVGAIRIEGHVLLHVLLHANLFMGGGKRGRRGLRVEGAGWKRELGLLLVGTLSRIS